MPDPALSTAPLSTLVTQLQALSTTGAATPSVISIAEGTYNFRNATTQFFPIRKRGVTIRANDGQNVVLKNLQLQIDPDSADDIVIQDIAFRSDGGFASTDRPRKPRDGIVFLSSGATPTEPDPPAPPRSRITVQITRCSFDGYFDIAIDSNVIVGRPILYATIDHCLFFDDDPGKPQDTIVQDGKNVRKFVNRGAINISSKEHDGVGNSLFVISNCVFIDIWRRIPRVAEGNQALIYNNLMFRWGVGNNDDPPKKGTNEWTGVVTDNQGKAIVVENRFIPWRLKTEVTDTIGIGPDTTVDVGNPRAAGTKADGTPIAARADLTNEFDGANGVRLATQPLTSGARIEVIDLNTFYSGLGLPSVTPPNPGPITDWIAVLDAAGPLNSDRSVITATLRAVLQNVVDGTPMVPPDPPN